MSSVHFCISMFFYYFSSRFYVSSFNLSIVSYSISAPPSREFPSTPPKVKRGQEGCWGLRLYWFTLDREAILTIIIVIVVFLLLTSHHHHLTSSPASHKPHSAWSAGQCLAGRPLSGPATLDFKIRYYENYLTLKYGEIKLPCWLLE